MFNAEVKSRIDEDICILIKVDNHSYNYICECGEAKDLGVKECQNTNAIFISHTHIDHFVNFDTILRHQIGINRKVTIVGPPGIIDQVQNRIKSYCWNLIEKGSVSYEVREIKSFGIYNSAILNPPLWEKEEEKTVKSDIVFVERDFEVEYEILDHKTESIAYLFRGFDKTKITLSGEFKGGKWVGKLKKAFENQNFDENIIVGEKEYKAKDLFHLVNLEKGKRLGIIMDHAASINNHNKIKAKFENCGDAFIECFYKDEDKEFADRNHHSYASKSGKIMKESNIVNAVPVHFSRKYEEADIQELISQFESAFNETKSVKL